MSVESGYLVFCSSRGDGAIIHLNACVLLFFPLHGFIFLLSLVFVLVFFSLFSCLVSFGHGRIQSFGISISSHVALSTCSITILPHYSTSFYLPGACIRFPRLY